MTLARAVVLAVVLSGAPLAAATAPDTPAGRRFADLMELTDAGDAAAIAAYVNDEFGESMRRAGPGDPGIAAFIADHATRFGGFEVESTLSATDEQVTMLVRPRSQPDRWLRYVVAVAPRPPHLVEGLFLLPARPGDIPREGEALDPDAAVAAFEADVDRLIAGGGFSGVALLARGDEVVVERVAGIADRDHGVPVARDTVFGIASMNKMFTAVALARLVERGRIAWADPVGRHLEGWLPDELARTITIERLLTHTSGLGDYLDRIPDDRELREARSLAPYRRLTREASVAEGDDGEMRYSNLGYVVLGALIEAVSGRDYFDVVRETVYAPAGMTSTGSFCADEVVPRRATGYVAPDEAERLGLGRGWRSNASLTGLRGTSAGGGYSTADDLLRFARALVGGALVRPATLDALLTPRVRFPLGGSYGYGFVVHETPDGGRIFGHAGGFPGANGELKVYGDGAWTLVVLSNRSGGAGEIVGAWDGIAARLRRAAP